MINTMYEKLLTQGDKKSIALEYLGQKVSYKKLLTYVDDVACKLKQVGLKRGDCISVALTNCISAVTLLYGANKIGVTCNMLHPLLPVKKLLAYSEKTESKMLFVADLIVDKYISELVKHEEIQTVVCNTEEYLTGVRRLIAAGKVSAFRTNCKFAYNFRQFTEGKSYPVKVEGRKEDIAVIMHGGGVEGEPQSIALTNKNMNSNADGLVSVIEEDVKQSEKYCMLSAIPFFHAFGLCACVHAMLSFGFKVFLMPKYSAKDTVKLIQRGKISYIAGVPTMFRSIIEQKEAENGGLKSLRYAFCGSEKLSKSLKDSFDRLAAKAGSQATLDEGYGLTEGCGVTSVNIRPFIKEGSVGKSFYNFSVEAFDEQGKLLPRNTEGELCQSGDAIFLGYYKDELATNRVKFIYNGDVWLKTGDLGYVDFEDYVYLTGRKKRIAKVSGITVFPSEAEDLIDTIAGVKKCAVVAVRHEYKGEVLKAFVELEDNYSADEMLAKIKNVCKTELGRWESPRYIVFEEIPLRENGDIDYEKLSAEDKPL